jgi:N-methylhydantoinase A/oxoprolinase/acetone carboxylase beta subunit
VGAGVVAAIEGVLKQSAVAPETITGVMIGTTQFTNAIVERRRLVPVAIVRLALPATESLNPLIDWPRDLVDAIGRNVYMAKGGYEVDGREISPLDEAEIAGIARDIAAKGLESIAISSVFAPLNSTQEDRAAEIIRAEHPEAQITLSNEIGRVGLIERENAAVMNAALVRLSARVVGAFRDSLKALEIDAPFFISQNDGTLMNADFAKEYPVLTFASGPTNSMRGAAFLSGLRDAIVGDVGGTTTDIGVLQHGFPRVAALAVDIGGVRTNFRMPDTYSIGLGGGSLIESDPVKVGPRSVGYELTEKALVFGGDILTATDVIVAGGSENIGDASAVASLDSGLVSAVQARIMEMIAIAVDRMKTSATPVPVIVVGGGSILVTGEIEGASEIIKPDHFPVANAIGAAIAQVGGECDRIFSLAELSRDEALDQAKGEASDRAINAGADADSIEIVDVEEVPLAYLPGNATRIMVKAIGDLVEA